LVARAAARVAVVAVAEAAAVAAAVLGVGAAVLQLTLRGVPRRVVPHGRPAAERCLAPL
jgi:hypothetical protein